MPTVQIKNITFHPSIWPKMIGKVSRNASPGALVQVLGKEGTPFGWGLWNHRSNMPLRIVSHSLEDLDESFFDDAVPPCSDGKSTNWTTPFHPSPIPSTAPPSASPQKQISWQ